VRTVTAALLFSLIALPAFAQAPPAQPARSAPRVDAPWFVAVNVTAQNAAGTLRDSFTYEAFAENGTIDAEYPGQTAATIDVTAGRRVWRRLGLAVGFNRATADGDAPLSARVPHPLYPNQHRDVSGEAGGISRTETAAHVQVFYDARPRGRWRLRVSGGPSFFNAEQQIVETIDTNEVYPFDSSEFRSATLGNASGSGVGFNAGVDLSWMLTPRFGVGALARFTRASLDLTADGSRDVPSDVGGLQAGGGIRIAF
jgi:hypothetical protein